MPLPIRVICEGCLQSVEFSGELSGSAESLCPSCGNHLFVSRPPSTDPTNEFTPRYASRSDERPSVQVNIWSRVAVGQIGRFKLERLLGDGGYGQVFLAWDTKMGRHVALKVLKPQKLDEKSLNRFLQEAKLAGMLDHPNIVSVWDYGRDDERSWISYKLIRGRTLAETLNNRRFSQSEAASIALKIASALEYAHGKGITHRDVKPSNIMLDEKMNPYLTDFGLARRMDLNSELTNIGAVLGSMNYMSPEQSMGRANEADGRSDTFSLGIVLFEMLCGRVPIDHNETHPIESRKPLTQPYPSVRQFNGYVTKSLDRICQRAIRIEPSDRFQQARDFELALERWLASESRQSRGAGGVRSKGVIAGLCSIVALGGIYGFFKTPPKQPVVVEQTALQTQSPAPAALTPKIELVGNASSHSLHLPSCPSIKNMKDANRREFATFEEARNAGFKPCDRCRPNAGG